mgnify:CR=1 FL=1
MQSIGWGVNNLMINKIVHEAYRAKQTIIDNIDYCSGVPDFLYMKPCCKNHDEDYANQVGKFQADYNFVKCGLTNASTYSTWHKRLRSRTVAITYYLGVTIFGWLPYYNAGKKK